MMMHPPDPGPSVRSGVRRVLAVPLTRSFLFRFRPAVSVLPFPLIRFRRSLPFWSY